MKSKYSFYILNRQYSSEEYKPMLISRNYARSSNLMYWYRVRASMMSENWYVLLKLHPRRDIVTRHVFDRRMLRVGKELGLKVRKGEE